MNFDWTRLLFPLLFAVIAIVALRAIGKFGVKGAMFGARVSRTVGEVRGAKQRIGSLVLRVHVLEKGAADRAVGIALIGKTPLSYQMLPIVLSVSDTRGLISMLQQAADEAA